MPLNGSRYSVLIVSSSDKFIQTLGPLLPEADYHPVKVVTSVSEARRAVLERTYDMVLINAPLPDDFGTRFAIEVSSSKHTVCLMFVKADIHEDVYAKLVDLGVFTIPKPTSVPAIAQALRWLNVARERLRLIETKTVSMEDKMKEIRIINRAKWLLIENLNMSEDEAHRYLEKQAMDRSESKKSIAEGIIKTYS